MSDPVQELYNGGFVTFRGMREVTDAIAKARREGAEEMRGRAATLCLNRWKSESLPTKAGVAGDLHDRIRELPLMPDESVAAKCDICTPERGCPDHGPSLIDIGREG